MVITYIGNKIFCGVLQFLNSPPTLDWAPTTLLDTVFVYPLPVRVQTPVLHCARREIRNRQQIQFGQRVIHTCVLLHRFEQFWRFVSNVFGLLHVTSVRVYADVTRPHGVKFAHEKRHQVRGHRRSLHVVIPVHVRILSAYVPGKIHKLLRSVYDGHRVRTEVNPQVRILPINRFRLIPRPPCWRPKIRVP